MAKKVVVTDFASHATQIRAVRTAVFVEEQAISRDDEFDEYDSSCIHAIVLDEEIPIATGRLDLSQEGRMGRIAVLKSHRRQGIGTLVMNALEAEAAKQGQARIWFHAQLSAVPFYESLGYSAIGEHFVEENIPHVRMEKRLPKH